MSQALPCLVCGRALENVWDGAINQPSHGVSCLTSGNYGSTAFDSMNDEMLEFSICDECLVRAGEQGRVLIGRHRRQPVVYVPKVWQPGVDDYVYDDELE